MLSQITIKDEEKWDEIVKSFNKYDVYYLPEYTKAFWLHGDGEPILFYFKDKKIKAINAVMKRDIAESGNFFGTIPSGTLFDITTPYGYGGFLIEGQIEEDSLRLLTEEYADLCKHENIVSEFVRFHPVLKNSEIISVLYDISDLGRTITIELGSQKQIWNDMAGRSRNVIRKARKAGVEIYWGRDIKLIDEFTNLYNKTMKEGNANNYYFFEKDFYDSILYDLKYNSTIFYATFEGKIIAMSMILHANKYMHYHLSASDKNFQHLAPNNLLLYEVSCWGCENGYQKLHLGGGLGSQEDSLFKFKAAFNKNSSTFFSVGKKTFNNDEYNKLIKIRKQESGFDYSTSFFPAYRG